MRRVLPGGPGRSTLSCLRRAPDALRFQGIATQGTSLVDETAVSPKVARG